MRVVYAVQLGLWLELPGAVRVNCLHGRRSHRLVLGWSMF